MAEGIDEHRQGKSREADKCHSCQRRPGKLYKFWFGKKYSQQDIPQGKLVKYEVYGSREVPLCDLCVLKQRVLEIGISVGLLLAGVMTHLFLRPFRISLQEHSLTFVRAVVWFFVSVLFILGYLAGFAGGILLLGEFFTKKSEIGARKAENMHSGRLAKEGYDKCWHTDPWKERN